MKGKEIFVILTTVLTLSHSISAQAPDWPHSSNYVYFGSPNLNQSLSGNYALLQEKLTGYTFLNSPVELRLRINNSDQFIVKGSGLVGIGTTSPSQKLHVVGTVKVSNASDGNEIFLNSNGMISTLRSGGNQLSIQSTAWRWDLDVDESENNSFRLRNMNNGTAPFTVTTSGDIGIGTETPDAKLTVKGGIHTQEVTVDLQGAVAPDFVFEEDFDLKSLEETEEYIQANKHLPEIPSAAEMEENGVELKEMNLKLLQKVEEMTLHLIEQNKINKAQEDRITELERKLVGGN